MAKHNAEKYERLAKYSLDSENRKIYARRGSEWNEKIRSSGFGAKNSSDVLVPKHKQPEIIDNIDMSDLKIVQSVIDKFEKEAINETIETACVITKNGTVYKCYGVKDGVFPDFDLGNKLIGAIVSHNHPVEETMYTFSSADMSLFFKYHLEKLRGCDKKYTYELTNDSSNIDEEPADWRNVENFEHGRIIELAKNLGIGYRRRLNE